MARLGEGEEQACTLHSASSKGSTKPWFRKQGSTLVKFMCCQIFVPEKFRRKIHADGQGSFCLVFFHFISLVATIRMYYRDLECCNTTVWMFNRDRHFTVASRKTIRFLTLRLLWFPRFIGPDVNSVTSKSYEIRANARGLALEYENIPLLFFRCSPLDKIVELFDYCLEVMETDNFGIYRFWLT